MMTTSNTIFIICSWVFVGIIILSLFFEKILSYYEAEFESKLKLFLFNLIIGGPILGISMVVAFWLGELFSDYKQGGDY